MNKKSNRFSAEKDKNDSFESRWESRSFLFTQKKKQLVFGQQITCKNESLSTLT